eukprot:scaffold16596_cov107-Isochrysis_galbana.AAC.3
MRAAREGGVQRERREWGASLYLSLHPSRAGQHAPPARTHALSEPRRDRSEMLYNTSESLPGGSLRA